MQQYYSKTLWDNSILSILDLPINVPQYKKTLYNRIIKIIRNNPSKKNELGILIKNKIENSDEFINSTWIWYINNNYTRLIYRPSTLYKFLNIFKSKLLPDHIFTMNFSNKGEIPSLIEV